MTGKFFMVIWFKLLLATMIVVATASCSPAQRTADGGCYYAGKGVLQILGAAGDVVVAWADAQMETQYQQNQIELRRLYDEFENIDLENLRRRYNKALALNNTYEIHRIEFEMDSWERKADRVEYLKDSISRYQQRQKKELERGPQQSLSQMIDESGDCEE